MKYFEAWLVGVVGVFGMFQLACWFILMCLDKEDEWWGGLPLWVTGALGVLVPLAAGLIAMISYLLQ